ncbi:hypothetical protein SCHPADRAFT_824523 [Schizopora paradoxa]|uniref:Phosphatidate cytidylyltransferase n=1 Tax=Schizopora paradoxa TaxID=27342 RepID=A0A0H2RUK1_9AGAM|nr:hypothetical protein SCHPADRAFT_824523 [Schizopora paradoxa]
MPSARRAITRSPSPKVIFNGARVAPGEGAVKRTRRTSLANGDSTATALLNGNGVHTIPEDLTEKTEDGKDRKLVKKKVDWEIPRKVFHSSIGFFVIPLYTTNTSPTTVAKNLSAALGVITLVDIVRLRSSRFASIYEKFLGFLMRDSEKKKINGVIWYLCGCIFVLALYPADIAVVSILILSWCDTTASFIGRLWGSKTPALPQSLPLPFSSFFSSPSPQSPSSSSSKKLQQPASPLRIPLPFASRKSLAGSLAATLTGAAIGVGFWGYLAPSIAASSSVPVPPGAIAPAWSTLGVVAAVTGIVAGVAEALDIGSLDDNLTLPIISGGVIWIFLKYLGHLL